MPAAVYKRIRLALYIDLDRSTESYQALVELKRTAAQKCQMNNYSETYRSAVLQCWASGRDIGQSAVYV